jgi:hypothetical protein
VIRGRAENKRLERQLEHDDARQRDEHAHQRALRERDELRGVIDDTIKEAQAGIYAARRLEYGVKRSGDRQQDAPSIYTQAHSDVQAGVQALNGLQSRLAVRLPWGAPLTDAVQECRNKLDMARLYGEFAWPEADGRSQNELADRMTELEAAWTRAESEARKLAESRLSPEPGDNGGLDARDERA